MKSRLIILLLCITLSVAGGVYFLLHRGFSIILTEQELQTRIAQAFPIEKTYFLAFDISLTNPVLVLEEGSSRIKFGLNSTAALLGKQRVSGQGVVSSLIRYDKNSGEFYLDELKVESLELKGLPEKYKSEILDLASVSLNKFYSNHPVYKLNETLEHRAAKMFLKNVQISHRSVIIQMGVGR